MTSQLDLLPGGQGREDLAREPLAALLERADLSVEVHARRRGQILELLDLVDDVQDRPLEAQTFGYAGIRQDPLGRPVRLRGSAGIDLPPHRC